jgi:23S rRNA (cytidine1920-2'-O)/16S rRNA (cytidine1409-2'-O)-methyltransferase
MIKERLDTLVVRNGLAVSREQAKRLIMAGAVRLNGHPVLKCGHRFPVDSVFEVAERPRFVSRGGDKLQGAFAAFPNFNVQGLLALDVGASTGGFTDCMLQHGAARVIALDVGRGQLHWKLRQDSRVCVIERFNARYMKPDDLPGQPQVAVTDVSFISLKLILPPMAAVLPAGGEIVSLIKPQFEAGRGKAPGGVVRDESVRQAVVDDIHRFGIEQLGLEWLGCVTSPLRGPEGNVEFLAYWRKAENR